MLYEVITFLVGIVSGVLTDLLMGRLSRPGDCCDEEFTVHAHHDTERFSWSNLRGKLSHAALPFLVLMGTGLGFAGLTVFRMVRGGVGIENSIWLTVMVILVVVTLFSSPHFLKQHLWKSYNFV